MSAPVPEVDAVLVEVLAAHQWHHTRDTHCSCGFRTPLAQLAWDGWIAHLARAVQGYVEGRVAAALEDAAVAVERRRDAEHIGPGSWTFGATEPFWIGDRFYDIAAQIVRSDARRSPETASTPDGGRGGVRGGEGA